MFMTDIIQLVSLSLYFFYHNSKCNVDACVCPSMYMLGPILLRASTMSQGEGRGVCDVSEIEKTLLKEIISNN